MYNAGDYRELAHVYNAGDYRELAHNICIILGVMRVSTQPRSHRAAAKFSLFAYRPGIKP